MLLFPERFRRFPSPTPPGKDLLPQKETALNFHTIGYALLCIVVPLTWGLVVVWASAKIETLRGQPESSPDNPGATPMPPIDYHI